MEKLFKIEDGKFYLTAGVNQLLLDGKISIDFIGQSIMRHLKNDCDNKYSEDREYNLDAINNGGRVLSVYEHKGYRFYINSYVNEGVSHETVAMLCEEY